MDFESWKDLQPSTWKYQDVLVEQEIETYKELHKMLYRSLSMMIHDIAFIAACVELQDTELNFDWISIKIFHRDTFENLIMRMYRVFFDNSGSDAYSLLRFKNRVVGKQIKPEYRQQLADSIKNLHIANKSYKSQLDSIRNNLILLRDQYIGHGLLNPTGSATVNLDELKELLEYGCELFQTLSFNVCDFYRGMSDGFGFEAEWKYTYESSKRFIKLSQLSSTYISKLFCEYDECCPENVRNKLEGIVQELNLHKRKALHKAVSEEKENVE